MPRFILKCKNPYSNFFALDSFPAVLYHKNMTTRALLEKARHQKIGSAPVVVLPLRTWQEIEERIEDAELLSSETLRKKVARARAEKKLYSVSQARRALGA